MIDALHILFDNRTFVEISGDVVRGGANKLHALATCLMMRRGSLKPGKKLW